MAPAGGQAETEGVQCFYQAGARPADPAGGGISVWLVFRDRSRGLRGISGSGREPGCRFSP